MKRIFLLTVLLCGLNGCAAATKSEVAEGGGSTAAGKLAVGDTAVFKFSRQGHVEGKVEGLDGTRYKLLYGQSSQTVDAVDVYPLPQSGAKVDIKPGDIVVAHQREAYWPGAEVRSVSGDIVQVQLIATGDSLNVPHEKVIKLNSAAAAEFKQYAQEVAFLKAAKNGRPHPPAGYAPKAGERVVAEWTDKTWYIGEVVSAAGGKAKIKWPTSFPQSELVFDKILPFPAPNTTPNVNDYLVVKTERETSAYAFAQVTGVSGGNIEVRFADGKSGTTKQGDFYLVN